MVATLGARIRKRFEGKHSKDLAGPPSMKVALVNKHYQLGGAETVVHQLWHGLPGRGIGAELWISEFGHLPAHESVHPLYPPLLNRLLHSRFANVTQHIFPRREWTAYEFEKIRPCDCNVVYVHGFDETYPDMEALVELAHAKPMALTLRGAWFFTGGCERFTKACGQCPQAGMAHSCVLHRRKQ
jgi:hypothetical protein